MQTLKDLPAPVLKALEAATKKAMQGRRAELGQVSATFDVDQTVVVNVKGTVKVSNSTADAVVAQSAKPWGMVVHLLAELNRERAAADKVGINLEQVVEMAESADPKLVEQAQKQADEHIKAIKEEQRRFRWGGTSFAGETTVVATGDHREERDAG